MKVKIIGIIAAVALMAGMAPAKADDGRVVITTIIGAAAGGVLGAQLGKGDGRLVATAAGTLIGAVIGHHIGNQNTDPYDSEPVVYTPPTKKRTYGNNQAVEVQKTIIVKKKIVKHVVVHEYENDYVTHNGHKNKHKKWNKKKNHKKHMQVVYSCNQHKMKNNCRKYN